MPGLLREIAEGEAAGVAGARHRLLRRHRPRCRALRCARPRCVGIGEAAFHVASLIAERFRVVTTLSRSIPCDRDTISLQLRPAPLRQGARPEVPVLTLEDPASDAARRICGTRSSARKAEDRAEAIVLGCAGMADLAADSAASTACRWSTAWQRP